MKKFQVAAQLYSFREFIKTPEGVEKTFRKLHEMGYEAVQLSSSLAPMPEAQLKMLLDQYHLFPCSSHEGAGKLIEEPEKVIESLKKLDVSHVAYPAPHISVNSKEEVIQLAQTLNDRAKQFSEAGIEFAYHNHSAEFIKFENETCLDLIYRTAPALNAELDTFWVQAGGGSPLEWIARMTNRMTVLHIKDYGMHRKDPGAFGSVEVVMTSIGAGNLNWKEIVKTAEKVGVKWFVVEHDSHCPDPFLSFESSMKYLKQHFFS